MMKLISSPVVCIAQPGTNVLQSYESGLCFTDSSCSQSGSFFPGAICGFSICAHTLRGLKSKWVVFLFCCTWQTWGVRVGGGRWRKRRQQVFQSAMCQCWEITRHADSTRCQQVCSLFTEFPLLVKCQTYSDGFVCEYYCTSLPF